MLSLSKNNIFVCSVGVGVVTLGVGEGTGEGVGVVEGLAVVDGEVVLLVQPARDNDATIRSTTTAAAFLIIRVTSLTPLFQEEYLNQKHKTPL